MDNCAAREASSYQNLPLRFSHLSFPLPLPFSQVPHDVKGNAIFTFVILRPGYAMDAKLQSELKQVVRKEVCARVLCACVCQSHKTNKTDINKQNTNKQTSKYTHVHLPTHPSTHTRIHTHTH